MSNLRASPRRRRPSTCPHSGRSFTRRISTASIVVMVLGAIAGCEKTKQTAPAQPEKPVNTGAVVEEKLERPMPPPETREAIEAACPGSIKHIQMVRAEETEFRQIQCVYDVCVGKSGFCRGILTRLRQARIAHTGIMKGLSKPACVESVVADLQRLSWEELSAADQKAYACMKARCLEDLSTDVCIKAIPFAKDRSLDDDAVVMKKRHDVIEKRLASMSPEELVAMRRQHQTEALVGLEAACKGGDNRSCVTANSLRAQLAQ